MPCERVTQAGDFAETPVYPTHNTVWHGMRSEVTTVQSQLQSKRLSWLGHTFGLSRDRLPQLLFGEVKGLCPPGCPRSSF